MGGSQVWEIFSGLLVEILEELRPILSEKPGTEIRDHLTATNDSGYYEFGGGRLLASRFFVHPICLSSLGFDFLHKRNQLAIYTY